MSLGTTVTAIAYHRMRPYYVAIVAGALLVVSAFMPWVQVGDTAVGGVPEFASLWILALGLIALTLASLSIYTRRNSRHPLLLVGLIALGILFLAYQWLERSAREQVWARAQALAIVDNVEAPAMPQTAIGFGVYLGLSASVLLVLFGLTIVIKRASTPYAITEDDDV